MLRSPEKPGFLTWIMVEIGRKSGLKVFLGVKFPIFANLVE